MRFDRELLDSLVEQGWLRSQRHPDADLWIYNYTEKTQFETHWTPETLACRGLILDAEGGIVARPFPKFFNYGDPLVGPLKAQVESASALYRGKPSTEDRREIADYFKRSGGNTAVLFRMLDGKPYDDLIWKAIKPEPTTPDTVWTRDAGVRAA